MARLVAPGGRIYRCMGKYEFAIDRERARQARLVVHLASSSIAASTAARPRPRPGRSSAPTSRHCPKGPGRPPEPPGARPIDRGDESKSVPMARARSAPEAAGQVAGDGELGLEPEGLVEGDPGPFGLAVGVEGPGEPDEDLGAGRGRASRRR